MSHEQPRRRQQDQEQHQDPIKYGDVFNVSGDLAQKPVAPAYGSLMQSAGEIMFGKIPTGGTASVMQSAADTNERLGSAGHRDASDVARDQGVTVTAETVGGNRLVTESVSGQAVGQYVKPLATVQGGTRGGARTGAGAGAGITIGEALEATALTVGDKPVEQSDAAAIQAAEVRATGTNIMTPGGPGATAEGAVAYNLQSDEDKVKLGDVVAGATGILPADKPATRQDAEVVVGAEMRNDPNISTTPGGVSAAVAAAARFNELANH